MEFELAEEQEALIKKQEEDLRNKTATEGIANAVEKIVGELKKLEILLREWVLFRAKKGDNDNG